MLHAALGRQHPACIEERERTFARSPSLELRRPRRNEGREHKVRRRSSRPIYIYMEWKDSLGFR